MRTYCTYLFTGLLPLALISQSGPNPFIVLVSPLQCTATPVTFTAGNTHAKMSHTWNVTPNRGVTYPANLNASAATFSFASAGAFSVSLIVKDSTGTASTAMVVSIARNPIASFNANFEEAGFPNRLELTNVSTAQLKNYWIFSDQASRDSSFSTKKDYSASGNYTVSLVALGTRGCSDTARYVFHLSDSSGVTLPNVFTPNGDDINDVMRPIVRGIHTLNAAVYNRYGVLMTSWNRTGGFWDGYTAAGEPCSAGVYFVFIEAYGFDGKVTKLKGTVTLLR